MLLKTTAIAIPMSKTNYTIRIDPSQRAELESAASDAGYKSLSAFLVAAGLEKAGQRREQSQLEAFEERMAASFERLASLVQLVNDGTQINIAQGDVLAKSFYACVPEPVQEALPAALASAKLRHARFQRAVKKDAQGIE